MQVQLLRLLNVKSGSHTILPECEPMSRPTSTVCQTAMAQAFAIALTKPDGSFVARMPAEANALLTT